MQFYHGDLSSSLVQLNSCVTLNISLSAASMSGPNNSSPPVGIETWASEKSTTALLCSPGIPFLFLPAQNLQVTSLKGQRFYTSHSLDVRFQNKGLEPPSLIPGKLRDLNSSLGSNVFPKPRSLIVTETQERSQRAEYLLSGPQPNSLWGRNHIFQSWTHKQGRLLALERNLQAYVSQR